MDKISIIFLDFDGVLALNCIERDEFGALLHQDFVNNLARIIKETDAKIVISSTWRSSGLSVMQDMWKKRNLPGEVVGITGYNDLRYRGLEIKEYLDKVCQFQRINWSKKVQQEYLNTSKCKNYVILDDDSDMLLCQYEHFVRCSNNRKHKQALDVGYGLTEECADKAIKILNTPLVDLYYPDEIDEIN